MVSCVCIFSATSQPIDVNEDSSVPSYATPGNDSEEDDVNTEQDSVQHEESEVEDKDDGDSGEEVEDENEMDIEEESDEEKDEEEEAEEDEEVEEEEEEEDDEEEEKQEEDMEEEEVITEDGIEEKYEYGSDDDSDGGNSIKDKKKNVSFVEMMNLFVENKCDTVLFQAKGGIAVEYDFNNPGERKILRKVIATCPKGSVWTPMCRKRVIDDDKVASKNRKSFAKGFTTGSDSDDQSMKKPSKKNSKKKDGKVGSGKTKKQHARKDSNGSDSDDLSMKKPSQKNNKKKDGNVGSGKTKKQHARKDTNRTARARKSGGQGVKGKVVDLNSDDSEEDDLSFNGGDISKGIKEIREHSKSIKPLQISVSGAFVNVDTAEHSYVVIFPRPGPTFYMKSEYYQYLIQLLHKKRKALKPTENGDWIDTIGYFRCREKEYGDESKWYRTEKKGNTIDLIYFVHTVPMDNQESFEPLLAQKIKYFIDVTKKRKTNVTGRWAIEYACNLRTGKAAGLGKFLLAKGAGDTDKAATIITEELNG